MKRLEKWANKQHLARIGSQICYHEAGEVNNEQGQPVCVRCGKVNPKPRPYVAWEDTFYVSYRSEQKGQPK